MFRQVILLRWIPVLALLIASREARADNTPGYPERVLQWTVMPGETCDDIAKALYGFAVHRALVERYSDVHCATGEPLPAGQTLVVPAAVTTVARAWLTSMAPSVREKPPGGAWEPAHQGMELYRNHSVNTLERARADILFVDRSKVVMAAHTLVVIYGTAASTSAVSLAPNIELESGELQAGLRALRGKAPLVAVKSGGDVQANSRDTVVRHQKARSTVSVFDGTAKIRSGGGAVTVPQNFGSSFRPKQKPTPPRPLPSAPTWLPGADEGVRLSTAAPTVIEEAWTPIERATAYRLEFARDPEFQELVAREEVDAKVTHFRAEAMPEGSYYLRVRAIDDEDFLGLASAVRAVTLVRVSTEGASPSVAPGELRVSPYAVLSFKTAAAPETGLEVSFDDAAFEGVPARLELLRRPIRAMRFRTQPGASVSSYSVVYEEPQVTLSVHRAGGSDEVRLGVDEAWAGELAARGKLRLRILRRSGRVEVLPLPAPRLARVATTADAPTRYELFDVRGRRLASEDVEVPEAPAVARQAPAHRTALCAPYVGARTRDTTGLWAPTACTAISGSWGAQATASASDSAQFASLQASANLGRWGMLAQFRSDVSSRKLHGDDGLWLGVTHRTIEARTWSLGPSLRLSLPTSDFSPGYRGELGLGLAREVARWTLLANLGFRSTLRQSDLGTAAPASQTFAAAGALLEFAQAVRAMGAVDVQLLRPEGKEALGRFGVTLAAETTTTVFAGAALHASPWQDGGGALSTQISLGIRR